MLGNDPRFCRWEEASDALRELPGFIRDDVQALGFMDVRLRRMELDATKPDLDAYYDVEKGDLAWQRNFELIVLSKWWVFAAYELVRSIHQHIKQRTLTRMSCAKEFQDLKEVLGVARIPLAKYELPGKKRSGPLETFIRPFGSKGFSWEVPSGDIIARKDLADQLLNQLCKLGKVLSKDPAVNIGRPDSAP
jgi:hypothetical protein